MATQFKRTQITHVPRVERILEIGRERFPNASAGAILVNLAEERANELGPVKPAEPQKRNGLTLWTGQGALTTQMVLDILNED